MIVFAKLIEPWERDRWLRAELIDPASNFPLGIHATHQIIIPGGGSEARASEVDHAQV